jgi:hypothetical protein
MDSTIVIKPHHFLDIIKLYGSGINGFVPDREYGHDFYRIGNLIIENNKILLTLTVNSDDICKPCRFSNEGKCSDRVENHGHYTSKEEWNRMVDIRLFALLGFKELQKIQALDFCDIASNRLETLCDVWKEEPFLKNEQRKRNLFNGIFKYIGSDLRNRL